MARILIIDDDEVLLYLFRQMLEQAGYEVVEALNGEVGLKLFRAERADLIITDIFMPEKDGLETIQDLRREFPRVKIIAMSGGEKRRHFSFLEAAQGLGADCVFAKPFKREEMLATIQELLDETVSLSNEL